jgi:hypothetical protein
MSEEKRNEVPLEASEVEFIIKVLSQLSVNPSAQDAMVVVRTVQSILSKLVKA